jgi:hypothetical protein
MKIGLLEHHQDPSETPRIISTAKARRLVYELKIAVHITPRLIKLTVAKSWSIIRAWLRGSFIEAQKASRAVDARAEQLNQLQARAKHPDGTCFNFGRWPSADQRTL